MRVGSVIRVFRATGNRARGGCRPCGRSDGPVEKIDRVVEDGGFRTCLGMDARSTRAKRRDRREASTPGCDGRRRHSGRSVHGALQRGLRGAKKGPWDGCRPSAKQVLKEYPCGRIAQSAAMPDRGVGLLVSPEWAARPDVRLETAGGCGRTIPGSRMHAAACCPDAVRLAGGHVVRPGARGNKRGR